MAYRNVSMPKKGKPRVLKSTTPPPGGGIPNKQVQVDARPSPIPNMRNAIPNEAGQVPPGRMRSVVPQEAPVPGIGGLQRMYSDAGMDPSFSQARLRAIQSVMPQAPQLPPRLQSQVDSGAMTPEGAANRYRMFQQGQLPGQQPQVQPSGGGMQNAAPPEGGQYTPPWANAAMPQGKPDLIQAAQQGGLPGGTAGPGLQGFPRLQQLIQSGQVNPQLAMQRLRGILPQGPPQQ